MILMEPVINTGDYYQALDIYVLPAHVEEFGRVVLKAMVYGLPAVVSDCVGASESLESVAREGIFPAGNKDLLADKIRRLAVEAGYRDKLGTQNRHTAQKYTEAAQMEKFVEILVRHKLIRSKRLRSAFFICQL